VQCVALIRTEATTRADLRAGGLGAGPFLLCVAHSMPTHIGAESALPEPVLAPGYPSPATTSDMSDTALDELLSVCRFCGKDESTEDLTPAILRVVAACPHILRNDRVPLVQSLRGVDNLVHGCMDCLRFCHRFQVFMQRFARMLQCVSPGLCTPTVALHGWSDYDRAQPLPPCPLSPISVPDRPCTALGAHTHHKRKHGEAFSATPPPPSPSSPLDRLGVTAAHNPRVCRCCGRATRRNRSAVRERKARNLLSGLEGVLEPFPGAPPLHAPGREGETLSGCEGCYRFLNRLRRMELGRLAAMVIEFDLVWAELEELVAGASHEDVKPADGVAVHW